MKPPFLPRPALVLLALLAGTLLSDKVTASRYQPDGTVARVRFDPPLQMYLTNTIRF